ncbi:MAG: hypothetical protein LBV27_08525 [Oscillospiraceae bacterium]|jgi:hypothetical protein|nr:hypothetical protein [Oscillospiraceae bacterium]
MFVYTVYGDNTVSRNRGAPWVGPVTGVSGVEPSSRVRRSYGVAYYPGLYKPENVSPPQEASPGYADIQEAYARPHSFKARQDQLFVKEGTDHLYIDHMKDPFLDYRSPAIKDDAEIVPPHTARLAETRARFGNSERLTV